MVQVHDVVTVLTLFLMTSHNLESSQSEQVFKSQTRDKEWKKKGGEDELKRGGVFYSSNNVHWGWGCKDFLLCLIS